MIGTLLALSAAASDPAFCVRTHIDPEVCFDSAAPSTGESGDGLYLECVLHPFTEPSVSQKVQLTPDAALGQAASLLIQQGAIQLRGNASVSRDGHGSISFALRNNEDTRPGAVFGTDTGWSVFGLANLGERRVYGECELIDSSAP